MSTVSDIKRLEADLNRWRAAFPGKTPEEVKQRIANLEHDANLPNSQNVRDGFNMASMTQEIDQLKRERAQGLCEEHQNTYHLPRPQAKSGCVICDLNQARDDALTKLAASEKQKEIYRDETHRWKAELAKAEAALAAVKVCGMCNGRGYDHGPGEGELSRCPTCDGQGTIRDYHSQAEAPKKFHNLYQGLVETQQEEIEQLHKKCAAKDDALRSFKRLVYAGCQVQAEHHDDASHSQECKVLTDALSPFCGSDYISRADAEAETLQKVKPLVELLAKLLHSLIGWRQTWFMQHSDSREIERRIEDAKVAEAHARTHFPKLFE